MTKVLIGFRKERQQMSKISPALYRSEDHTWMTPPELINALLRFEGRTEFDLDPCCSVKNIPARRHYAHPEHDGLVLPWSGVPHEGWPSLVWMNSPYGRMLAKFMAKAAAEADRGARIWMIVPARTETIYQHAYGLTKAGFVVFMKKRVSFIRSVQSADPGEDNNAPFPTMLLYMGPDWAEKAVRWEMAPAWPGSLMIQATVERARDLTQAHDDFYRVGIVA